MIANILYINIINTKKMEKELLTEKEKERAEKHSKIIMAFNEKRTTYPDVSNSRIINLTAKQFNYTYTGVYLTLKKKGII